MPICYLITPTRSSGSKRNLTTVQRAGKVANSTSMKPEAHALRKTALHDATSLERGPLAQVAGRDAEARLTKQARLGWGPLSNLPKLQLLPIGLAHSMDDVIRKCPSVTRASHCWTEPGEWAGARLGQFTCLCLSEPEIVPQLAFLYISDQFLTITALLWIR